MVRRAGDADDLGERRAGGADRDAGAGRLGDLDHEVEHHGGRKLADVLREHRRGGERERKPIIRAEIQESGQAG